MEMVGVQLGLRENKSEAAGAGLPDRKHAGRLREAKVRRRCGDVERFVEEAQDGSIAIATDADASGWVETRRGAPWEEAGESAGGEDA